MSKRTRSKGASAAASSSSKRAEQNNDDDNKNNNEQGEERNGLKRSKKKQRDDEIEQGEDEDQEDDGDEDDEDDGDEDDDDNEDDDEDEDDDEEMKKRKKKSYYVKKRKVAEEDLIEDPTQLPTVSGIPLEPLAKQKRQPAQERAYKELSAINERIASLVQVRQMGLSTAENKKQLKQLMKDRKKKAYELKRLQSKQRASNKYRVKRRKIVSDASLSSLHSPLSFQVEHLFETKPELHPQLNKLYRRGVGRPRIEEQCPDLLQIIEEIAKVGGASDDRRRSETIRPCLTLDDLREKIKQRGYDIKRTTLYYR